MSEPVCDACQDEPVLASGGLCPRCAYVARSNGADLSRLRAQYDAAVRAAQDSGAQDSGEQAARLAGELNALRAAVEALAGEWEECRAYRTFGQGPTWREAAHRLRSLLRPGGDDAKGTK